MKALAKSVLTMVLAASSMAAVAGDAWVRFGQDRDGEYFYDRDSLIRTGDTAQVRVRMLFNQSADQPPMSMIARQEFDCATQTSAVLSVQRFGAGPEPLRSTAIPPDHVQREPLFAGSSHEPLYRLLCPKGRRLPKFSGPALVTPRNP